MSPTHGRFVWYELMTGDVSAAKAFYTRVAGWSTQEMPAMGYTIFTAGGDMAAGLMALPAEAQGVPPHWMGHVAVDDIEATVAQAERLGAAVHVPPRNIPDMGRFAVLADPQGAAFSVYQGLQTPEPPPPMGTPQRIGWHELYASDWETSFAFYAELFGWQKDTAVPMGEMGTYQLFRYAGTEGGIGGMFNKPSAVPVCFWLYYVNVSDFDAATERVTSGGGQVVNGPMEVPGGAWIVQCLDPQGAMFALVGVR